MVHSTVDVKISSPTMSFDEYLEYEGEPGILYELEHGHLIEMATTTGLHNQICKFLAVEFLRHFVASNMNLVAIDLTGVRTQTTTSRIPDVVVCDSSFWKNICDQKGAAVLDFNQKPLLVVEVTSQNWRVDYNDKLTEYSGLNIPEYWIVDPDRSRVRLCSKTPGKGNYSEQDFLPGSSVRSVQFPGLVLPVNLVLEPPDVDYLVREEQKLRQELEQFKQLVDAERQRADAAEQRAFLLAQRLQALGIDPDSIN